jgi:PAS domain S-box-containing protein
MARKVVKFTSQAERDAVHLRNILEGSQLEFLQHERDYLEHERKLLIQREKFLKEQERVFSERVKRAGRQQFRHLLDSVPYLIAHLDDHQCVTFCNERYAKFFGIVPTKVIGKPIWEIFDSPEYDSTRRNFIQALEGQEVTFDVSLHPQAERYWHVTLIPDDLPKEGLTGFFILMLDISERKTLEDIIKKNAQRFRQLAGERARLLAEQKKLLREAHESSRLKDHFLAMLSHELRTPLTAIVGWSKLMNKRKLSPTQLAQGMEAIERNARIQAKLIDDLLDISRIVAGKIELQFSDVDVVGLVHSAVNSMRPSINEKNLSVKIEVLDGTAALIRADLNRLQQVMNNLLSNAVKFTPSGGHIEVAVQRNEHAVHLTVKDNGEGIDPSFLPHIFEEFRQADMSTSRSKAGLGLGLSIARGLVELHHGSIHAESAGLRKGASFIVKLPVEPEGAKSLVYTPAKLLRFNAG